MDQLKTDNNLIHPLTISSNQEGISYLNFAGILLGIIILGTIIGFVISKIFTLDKKVPKIQSQKTVGIADKKTFKDQASGILREGGIDGEGTFHLERPGGISQNVYLTSSTVDLFPFIGKKVRVWGETFKGEKAGWLMDVGLIELLQ